MGQIPISRIRFILPTLPIILGVLALIGWALDVSILKQGIASSVAMNPATAIGFILLGLEATRLHARNHVSWISRAGQLAIWVVIIASIMKLSDLMFGTSFAIDTQLFSMKLDAESGHSAGYPNRMAPNTALCFFVSGWAMQFLRGRSNSSILTAQLLAAIPALITLLAIVGYAYNVKPFYGIDDFIPMAFNTAVAFLSLFAAVLFTHPNKGYMRVFTNAGPAGAIASILLPAAFLVPFLLGWSSLVGQRAGLYDTAFDHALSVVLDIAMLFFLIYIAVRGLFLSDMRRQQAETELQKSESSMRAILDNSPFLVWLKDPEGRFITVNKVFADSIGLKDPGQITGKTDLDLWPKELAEKYRTDDAEVMTTRQRKHIEEEQALEGDRLFWVETFKTPILDKDGNLLGTTGFAHNITERKQVEQETRALAQRCHVLMQTAIDGIHVLDDQGNFVEGNDAFCRMLGYTHEEMAHLNVADWDAQWSAAELQTRFKEFGNKDPIFETLHRCKDGTLINVEIGASRVELDGRNYFFASSRDITRRKLAEQALWSVNEQLTALIEAIPDAIFFKDSESRWLITNETAKRLFQLHDIDWQGKTEMELAAAQPELRAAHETCLMEDEKAWESGELMLFQERIFDKDGQPHEYEVRKAPLFDDGRRKGLVIIGRDVTERKRMEESLNNMAAKYHTVFELSSDAIMLLNEEGFFDCNEAALRMFGCPTRDGLISKQPAELSPPTQPGGKDSMSLAKERIATAFKNGSNRFEWMHRRLDGVEFPAEVLLTVMELDGKLSLQAVVRDITERKHTEQELHIAATAFEAQEGMIVTDAKTRILRVNRAFTRLTGYSAEEAIGQTPAMLKSGRQDKGFYRDLWNTLNHDNYWQGEMWNRRKNGEVYPEWLTITAVTNAEGQVTNYIGAFSDITQHKQDEAEIHTLAFYDPLTGLPNRRLLRDRLRHMMAASARRKGHIAILFIDLDDFKTLNDTRGHDIGDQLLIEVARRMQACLRSDDTVARLGGDEFVVMLVDLGEEEAQAAAQAEAVGKKIHDAINQPYALSEQEYNGTASTGVSLFCCNDDTSMDEVLKHADTAMYQAKSAGRNALRFYDPAMQAILEARIILEADLRHALAENQLKLYYQMQGYHSGQIIGAEVLLRWQHPKRGLVPPLEFIPLAEETGLILPIGQWVLETACAQLKVWEADINTRHLKLAVNVSARQFYQPDFVEQVNEALLRSKINPDRLELELTESLVLNDIDDTIIKMRALKEIGLHFSMDDFGTGYSSLAYLTQLPLDTLKIDQSFVRNIGIKSSDAVIVQTVIGMANNLGMEVVAEGVETEKQRKFLERHGCPVCQGYLFSKPVPLEEFMEKLKSSSAG